MISDDHITRLRYSKPKLLLAMAFFLGMALAAVYVLSNGLVAPGSWRESIMWAALPIMVLMAAYNGYRLFQSHDIVIVSVDGLQDRRIGPLVMPWDQIERIWEARRAGHRFCRIMLKPEFEQAFPLSATERLRKSLNTGHDKVGHMMHFQGLTPAIDGFWQAVVRHCPEDKLG